MLFLYNRPGTLQAACSVNGGLKCKYLDVATSDKVYVGIVFSQIFSVHTDDNFFGCNKCFSARDNWSPDKKKTSVSSSESQ